MPLAVGLPHIQEEEEAACPAMEGEEDTVPQDTVRTVPLYLYGDCVYKCFV